MAGKWQYSFYLQGDGDEADRPCLSWEWAVFIGKGEPEEKFRNHGRNSQALLRILIVLAFFAAWTFPTQRTDSYKNCNKK